MRLRLEKIGGWWFIIYTTRMKYYKFKYYNEAQAREVFEALKESWLKSQFREELDAIYEFNVGMRDTLPAPMEDRL